MTWRWILAAVAGITIAALPSIAGAQSTQTAQDTLARARGLYESADYEAALQVLATLKSASTEASAYQVFCLVALGRSDEARAAVQSIVRADPTFHPPAGQISPRMRQFFDEVRMPMLPDAARLSYVNARASYDKKDWTAARDGFARTASLLDELKSSDTDLSDLKTLAMGFRDLAAAAIQSNAAAARPTPTPTPITMEPLGPGAPASTPTPAVLAPSIYSDSDTSVAKPIVKTRSMPPWHPNAVEAKMNFAGTLELIVGEDGKVLSTSMIKSVHPRYDGSLLEAAKSWTFQPATRNGTPVKYRYVMEIRLTSPIK